MDRIHHHEVIHSKRLRASAYLWILIWNIFVKSLEPTCLMASLLLLDWQARCSCNQRISHKAMTSLLGTLGRMESYATNYFVTSLASKIHQLFHQRRNNIQTTKSTHSSVGFATFDVRLECLARIAQLMSKHVKCKVAVSTKQDVASSNDSAMDCKLIALPMMDTITIFTFGMSQCQRSEC